MRRLSDGARLYITYVALVLGVVLILLLVGHWSKRGGPERLPLVAEAMEREVPPFGPLKIDVSPDGLILCIRARDPDGLACFVAPPPCTAPSQSIPLPSLTEEAR